MVFDIISKELAIAVAAWFFSQIAKCVISLALHRTLTPNILFGSGGMPSSHSATVCALSTALAFSCGTNSPVFAVSCIFSFIVMYDATGVRRETGDQGRVLNMMLELFHDMGKPIPAEKQLRELVGHTPMQVIVGAILGVVVGVAFMSL